MTRGQGEVPELRGEREWRRTWVERGAKVLSVACFGGLLAGVVIEGLWGGVLFEGYIGTFFGWGLICAVVVAVARGMRRRCGDD